MFKNGILLSLAVFAILAFSSCAGENVLEKHLPAPLSYSPPPADFVELKDLIPGIVLDIRYATTNNFMGKPLDGYKSERAFMLPEPAQALARVQEELESMRYSLKIYDAYRPMRSELQMIQWSRATGNEIFLRDGYLMSNIKPTNRFGHSSGNSVDLTIVDSSGLELDMGTQFDHFASSSWTANASGPVLKNRLLLKNLMEKHGFRNFSREWWHFNYWHAPHPPVDEEIQ
ncbi:MAG: peptidase M15 [Spirochaetaceae bacterium]|nr:MAG: peptidase M15 [Spirochaetaceae bacterium]